MTLVMELKIHLPKYHAKQIDFISSKAKRKCIVAGRRSGKTMGVAGDATSDLLKGRRILYAAPTSDQTSTFWTRCKRFLREPIQAGFIRKNETDRILEIKGGGRIRAKTAWDSDTLRGDYADKLILEEYSLMDPATWEEVGSPMLLDNNGDCIFIFTPKRKNHAWKLYQRAIGDTSGRWQAWHFTSHDNPYLSQEALAEIMQDMTDSAYRQEILAEFLESEGQIFRNLAACMNAPQTTLEQHMGHRKVAGLDWAKQSDFTATSIICDTCRCEVAKDRFNQIDYHFQRDRLKALYELWEVESITGEANSIGEPNIEELQRDGVNIIPFQTTAQSKSPLIESLALCFEKSECQFLSDPIWTGELEAYEVKVSSVGRSSYSAPAGMNDDTVIARALAWHNIYNNAPIQAIALGGW